MKENLLPRMVWELTHILFLFNDGHVLYLMSETVADRRRMHMIFMKNYGHVVFRDECGVCMYVYLIFQVTSTSQVIGARNEWLWMIMMAKWYSGRELPHILFLFNDGHVLRLISETVADRRRMHMICMINYGHVVFRDECGVCMYVCMFEILGRVNISGHWRP